MPALLLNIPYIQRKVSYIAEIELSNKLGVPVKVGSIEVEWFNRIVLENLYLEDESGETLFEASHVTAGFEPFPLIKGKFVFTTVRLFGFSVNLKKKTPEDKLNLQFVLDAFARKDTFPKNTNIDLRFNSVLIRKGNITYNVENESETPGKFNTKHIDIKNISAKISLKAFNNDSLNASIKKLSFDEVSGFSMNKLSLNITGNKDSINIRNFEIRLPQTNLKISQANILLKDIKNGTELLNKAALNLIISPSQICLKDLSTFVPAFQNFADTIELSANATGYINDIDFNQLILKYSEKMLFIGQMGLKDLTDPEKTYVVGKVNKLYLTTEGLIGLLNNFNKRPVKLPAPIVKLGTINFTGEISGFFDNLVAFGKLSSSVGSIQTDMIFGSDKEKNIAAYLKGHISTQGIHLNELFPEGNPYGNIRFDISLDASRPINGSFSGNIQAKLGEIDYKGYKYENILLSGDFRKNGFNGMAHIDDPNGKIQIEGLFKNEGENSAFNFSARVKDFHPDSLHFTNKYECPDISFALNADFTGNNIDNVQGNITVDSLSIKTTPSDFFLKKLEIEATGHREDRRLTITSDIVNGEITGAYSFNTIIPSFMNTFKGYLPTLINITQKEQTIEENNFSLLLTIENSEDLSETLKLPFTMINQGRITGHYNNLFNKFRIEAFLPKFKIGKSTFESGYLTCDNPSDKVNLKLKSIQYNAKGRRNYIDLSLDAKEDQLNTLISWANNKERLFKADLSASALFSQKQDEAGKSSLLTQIEILKSPIIINDSIWTISPAKVIVDNGKIAIDNFLASHENQYLRLDGIISKDVTDTLHLDLNKIELKYIFDILNIPALQFAGKATGTFNINDLYGSRMLNTDLEIQDFSFNQVTLGRLNLFSEWDDTQKGILMLGSIYKNDSTWTDVNGYIFPVGPDAGLSLYFDANDLNISFLHPFMQKIAKGVEGRGFGKLHLFGPFKKLNIEGDAFVQDGRLGIDFLDTYYTFSDSVHLRPNLISLHDLTIYDKDLNSGKVNLTVNHKNFKDFDFRVNVQVNNMLVYNASKKHNPLIYGTVYGTGSTTIVGDGQLVNFDINMRNEPNTSVYLNFMGNSKAADYDFIKFIDKSQMEQVVQSANVLDSINRINDEESAELRMNFLLDITPTANIELIIDPIGGDKIKGNGTGNLQIQYGNRNDLRIYGGYTIEAGNYNFSLQQIIHKDFKIREGSTIDFRGDPFNANMDINAIYNLTANIGDLDQSLLLESPRPNIPVNCVLMLNGMLRNPAISFDLELPNSNNELERQMKSLVDTEDMMTRQIVYLLVLNKFYTPDYSTNTYKSNEFSAVASSAISSQISSILNSFTDKVQIGTNIRASQDGFTDTEVEMLLSSQLLDNRLIFNGNFGYKNNLNTAEKNVFIGEFDLEYKLTPSGEIRLKAYNHANDLYRYLKTAQTTQGVGIMFKKDFTNFSDIFRRRKKQTPLNPPSRNIPSTPKDSVIPEKK